MDHLFDSPYGHMSSGYSTGRSTPPAEAANQPSLAYIGSMEVMDGWMSEHALPNAFMASHPQHPFWLLSLTGVLTSEKERSKGGGDDQDEYAAEMTTGPVALKRTVEMYRGIKQRGEALGELLDPSLRRSATVAPDQHELIAFANGVIYPFSWVTELGNARAHKTSPSTVERVSLRHCFAQVGAPFDAERCLGKLTHDGHC